MYAVCGLRSAVVWSLLSSGQILLIFLAELAGVRFARDLTAVSAHVFELSALLACIGAFAMVLGPLELARRASLAAFEHSNRVIERERILGDMHDGVGSQLLGLVVELRAQRIEGSRLLESVEGCLDDLRLAVHALDASQPSLELIFGEQRARLQARCDAARVELVWSSAILDPASTLDPAGVLQALRFVQEAFTNALRHARARRIELSLHRVPSEPRCIEIMVADDGIGFEPARVAGTGRGLTGLELRARRLGGQLRLTSSSAGTSVTLRIPG
jgi:signal transduction histidine kinase